PSSLRPYSPRRSGWDEVAMSIGNRSCCGLQPCKQCLHVSYALHERVNKVIERRKGAQASVTLHQAALFLFLIRREGIEQHLLRQLQNAAQEEAAIRLVLVAVACALVEPADMVAQAIVERIGDIGRLFVGLTEIKQQLVEAEIGGNRRVCPKGDR